MSTYLAGYIVIAIIILALVNVALIRRRKKQEARQIDVIQTQKLPETNEEVRTEAPSTADQVIGETLKESSIAEPAVEYVNEAVDQTPVTKKRMIKNEPEGEFKVGKILASLMLGAFVAILNQTLLNVAIPHIMTDLNVSANTVQWLSTGYMLVNAICIPITAFLIEKFGTRKLFLAAMFLFTLGSFICSISTTFSLLMIGRVIQAAGAGVIMPLMMTVFLTIFPPQKRGAAMGLMGVAMLFAPAIGPTLSGWLIEHYSWRLLFDIVLPFGVIDLIIAFLWMKDVIKTTNPKFDFLGFLFSTIGFGFLLYGFSEAGNDGWTDKVVLTSLTIGIIGLIAFVWRELTAEKPMLDLRVFKYDVFSLTTIISMAINMAMFGAMLLLPIYLQNIRGFTALDSGLLLLPGAIIMGIMSPISGALFDRIGARWLAIVGLSITVITTWQFSKLTTDTTYVHILFLYMARMFGMSFLMMTVMTAGLNQLPRHLASHGTAASNTARQVAGSLGTAFLVTVMSTRSTFHQTNFASSISSSNPYIVNKITQLGQGIAHAAGLPGEAGQSLATKMIYGEMMKKATIEGINDSFIVATGIAAVALILSCFIKRVLPQSGK